MSKTLLAIILSLVTGFAIAAFWLQESPAPAGFDVNAPPDERILALERAIVEERNARQLLEDELFRLIEEMDQRRDVADASVADEATPAQPAEAPAIAINRFSRRSGNLNPESRVQQLIASGFSAGRAEVIARREAELHMRALQARFEARQGGESFVDIVNRLNPDRVLREELGETEYEQYLGASGRPTSVAVNDVLQFSPAEQVGLQRGDEIVRYNGQRVYNVGELYSLQVDESLGENIVVDIVRDGVPMQVTMPRGPLGIMAGRRR